MITYTFLGATANSLAFRKNDNGIITDFGVFNFPAQIDSDGFEIVPAKNDYTQYFAGKPTSGAEFTQACETYLADNSLR